jgi:ribonucleoside-triphosphate reductase
MKNNNIYETFIAKSRYARYLDSEKRRENWPETVGRYFDAMEKHLKQKQNYVLTPELRTELQDAVTNFEVMPSMRALMTSGKALERDNTAGYNCSYLPVDDPKSFDEAMFILLCGTGVGFSVERQYITKLPDVPEKIFDSESTIVVSDSKEGWAKALRQVIAMLYSGEAPKWDVSKVRPAGARLKIFGGRASGPQPLIDLFKFVVKTFKTAQGRKLNSLECHDIMCKIGEVVVVGGVRRSAMISLSNLSDDRMRHAKSGAWWETQSQRALANNSSCYTERPDVGIFMQEWVSLYESKSGERGIFNREAAKNVVKMNGRRDVNFDFGTNPCSEIILRPYQFCNLTEIIVRATDTMEDLQRKARIATIMGTFQSSLTHFPYLRKIWRDNTEAERLLGVSMTGILDNALLNDPEDKDLPDRLELIKALTVAVNKDFAAQIGIPQAAAITAVKPSGCTSPETQVKTSAGILSMTELFKLAGHDITEYKNKSDVWLDATNLPKVYDENNQEQEITKLYINGLNPVIEIEFEDGKKYKFTENHKLLTSTGWKRVDELTVDDEIISF